MGGEHLHPLRVDFGLGRWGLHPRSKDGWGAASERRVTFCQRVLSSGAFRMPKVSPFGTIRSPVGITGGREFSLFGIVLPSSVAKESLSSSK